MQSKTEATSWNQEQQKEFFNLLESGVIADIENFINAHPVPQNIGTYKVTIDGVEYSVLDRLEQSVGFSTYENFGEFKKLFDLIFKNSKNIPEINKKDGDGKTILMRFIEERGTNSKGDIPDFIQLLIDKGVDVNIQDNDGNAVLIYMLDNPVSRNNPGRQAVTDFLIEKSDLSLRNAKTNETPADFVETKLKTMPNIRLDPLKPFRNYLTGILPKLKAAKPQEVAEIKEESENNNLEKTKTVKPKKRDFNFERFEAACKKLGGLDKEYQDKIQEMKDNLKNATDELEQIEKDCKDAIETDRSINEINEYSSAYGLAIKKYNEASIVSRNVNEVIDELPKLGVEPKPSDRGVIMNIIGYLDNIVTITGDTSLAMKLEKLKIESRLGEPDIEIKQKVRDTCVLFLIYMTKWIPDMLVKIKALIHDAKGLNPDNPEESYRKTFSNNMKNMFKSKPKPKP